jgi:lysozyme
MVWRFKMIDGVDVSHHQGFINWGAMRAAGIELAFPKLTEGNGYVDDQFSHNVAGCRQAGILIAPYHFLSHDIPAKAQADHFLKHLDRHHNPDFLLPAVDVEPDPASLKAIRNKAGGAVGTLWPPSYMVKLLDDFLTYVRQGIGKNITIYSYFDWWIHYMGNTKNYKDACPLWAAAYPGPPVEPISYGGWPYWTFHQWTDHGHVAGVEVDLDHFKGTIDDLKKFANY